MKKSNKNFALLSNKRLKRVLKLRREPRSYSGEQPGIEKKPHMPYKQRPYESIELSMLNSEYKRTKKPAYTSSNIKIKLPSVFSMIENPEDSLSVLYTVASHSNNTKLKSIFLEYYEINQIDLAAETLLDVLVKELNKENKAKHNTIAIRGSYPESDNLERYIRAIGIISHFDIKHEMLSASEVEPLKLFKMRSKRENEENLTGSLDYKSRAVKDFVDHINSCLMMNGKELTNDARSNLAIYTGEIISNAEEHSGIDDWSIVGYLDNSSEGHICEIAIFNFGMTIAETFQALDKDHFTYKEIKPYIELHKKKNIFGSGWTEEELTTLIALQGSISSKNVTSEDTRGQGTVELIEFFQQIHSECITDGEAPAKMAIISGKTHILFDGTYQLKKNSDGRLVIAFNKDNDLYQKPESKYITRMGATRFPGTIISIRFPMDVSQTKEKK